MLIRTKYYTLMFFLSVSACIIFKNLQLFRLIMAVITVPISAELLKKLIIYNFASDEYFLAYSKKYSCQSDINPIFTRLTIYMMNVLILLFYAVSYFMTTSETVRIFSVILFVIWSFDFAKTVFPFFKTENQDSEFTYLEYISELVMWLQGMLTLTFPIISMFLR